MEKEKGRGRASVFGASDEMDIDLSVFTPKPAAQPQSPTQEQVKAISEAANFPSRQAAPASKIPAKEKRTQRRYRTGRNVQFNAKASQETIDRFYAICDQNPGWVMGYTLERAVDALERELKQTRSTTPLITIPSARQTAARHKEKLDA
jgi:hypothetical protein